MPTRPDDRAFGRDPYADLQRKPEPGRDPRRHVGHDRAGADDRYAHSHGGHGPGEDASWRSYADEAYERQARYGDYDYGGGHGGQEYGLEREGGGYGGASGARRSGVGGADAPHDDQALEADYVAWRDEQLRAYDRDYAEWRAARSRRYDEEYRARRAERRERSGR